MSPQAAANSPLPRVLVVTDRKAHSRPLHETLAEFTAAVPCRVVVREKDLPTAQRVDLVSDLLARCPSLDLVVAVDAICDLDTSLWPSRVSGFHCSESVGRDLARRAGNHPALPFGVSRHGRSTTALPGGCAWVTLSPYFSSISKSGYAPDLTAPQLDAVCRDCPVPVYALSGVTPRNAAECLRRGAHGVALMGAVMRAHEPGDVGTRLAEAMRVVG